MSSISVIVPVNNEEENLQNFYQRTSVVLEKNFSNYEIIFVNDRSKDKSEEIARKNLDDYPNSKVINTDKSYVGNGKGMAVEMGMVEAKGDYRLFMDADNSTKFSEIDKFCRKAAPIGL